MTAIWSLAWSKPFWRFIAERQAMFRRRVLHRHPPPWTTDPVMARIYLTNVYRELDRGTRYLLTQILPQWPAPVERLWNVVLYRFFNRITTYEALLNWHDPERWRTPSVIRALRALQRQGPVFSGAYQFTTGGHTGTKIVIYAKWLGQINRALPQIWKALQATPTLQAAHGVFRQLPGVGGFVAYELAIDCCYATPRVVPLLPFSEDEWVHAGPGAVRGLQYLTGERVTPARAAGLIMDLRWAQIEGLALVHRSLGGGPPLTLRNIEHSLCEFAKYERARAGGRTKRTFAPATANADLTPWRALPRCYGAPRGEHNDDAL